MDDKFNPKDRFYCVKTGIRMTYHDCKFAKEQATHDCKDCITGQEIIQQIAEFEKRIEAKTKRGRPKKVKIDKELQSVAKPDPPPKQDKPKRLELKRKIYFTPRPDLLEKVEQLAKANIRTFSEQVLWMIQEYMHDHTAP